MFANFEIDKEKRLNNDYKYRLISNQSQYDKQYDKKSMWNSIKRKVSMTSLASSKRSTTLSSLTKRTKNSSTSSNDNVLECKLESKQRCETDVLAQLDRSYNRSSCNLSNNSKEDAEQWIRNGGVKRSVTSLNNNNKRNYRIHKRNASDGTKHNFNEKSTAVVIPFFDPDNGIAIGTHKELKLKPKAVEKRVRTHTRKKRKNNQNFTTFYEPNTAVAIGKVEDIVTFPDSKLMSPKIFSKKRTSKEIGVSTLPICDSQQPYKISTEKKLRARKLNNQNKKKPSMRSHKSSKTEKRKCTRSSIKIREAVKNFKKKKVFLMLVKLFKRKTN